MVRRGSMGFLCLVAMLLCCSNIEAGYVPQGEGVMSTPDQGLKENFFCERVLMRSKW